MGKKAKNLILCKKGNILMDTIVLIIILVALGIILTFGYKAFNDMESSITSDLTLNESVTLIQDTGDRYPSVMDGIFLFVFFGLWLAGIVSALVSDDHPVLFGVMLIAIVFVIIAGVILGNFYEELFQDSDLTGLVGSFPRTHWILTHMLPIGIVVGLSIGLVFYAKNKTYK